MESARSKQADTARHYRLYGTKKTELPGEGDEEGLEQLVYTAKVDDLCVWLVCKAVLRERARENGNGDGAEATGGGGEIDMPDIGVIVEGSERYRLAAEESVSTAFHSKGLSGYEDAQEARLGSAVRFELEGWHFEQHMDPTYHRWRNDACTRRNS